MSREFSAVKAGVGMFAAAPLVGALCPVINAVTAGGSLDGVLPGGAANRLSEGFAGIAAGAQARVHGLLDGLRGRGIGVDLGENSPAVGQLLPDGLPMPSGLGLGSLENNLAKVAGLARQGLAAGF